MNIRKATPDDIEQMMQIVAQAQAFLRENGVFQWQDGYPTREVILQDIASQQAYLLADGAQVAAFAVLIFGGDPNYANLYEGAWRGEGEYLTIHRVAANGALRQKGAASKLIAYAEQLCLEKGIKMMRIDTHAQNCAMLGMLEKNGFVRCGKVILSGGEDRVTLDKLL